MDEGKVFTSGNSFRALAEAHARKYRKKVLGLSNYDKYGHRLTREDALKGFNFLNNKIYEEVKKRNKQGKGIDLDRTSGNLLSSQAMCFNLFVPFKDHKVLLKKILNSKLNLSIKEIEKIKIEYTPGNDILADQSKISGVDCDVLIEYTHADNEKGIIVVETKYVETKFSRCSVNKNRESSSYCSGENLKTKCYYDKIKNYNYVRLTEESNLFKSEILNGSCPFSDSLWQIWVNLILAYGIAKKRSIPHYDYLVITPEANKKISRDGVIWEQFDAILKDKNKLNILYLEDIFSDINKLESKPDIFDKFAEKYLQIGR